MEVGLVDISVEVVKAAEAGSEHSAGRELEAEKAERPGRTG